MHECGIAAYLFEHHVDQYSVAAAAIAEQIGVGRGRRIEQLANPSMFSLLANHATVCASHRLVRSVAETPRYAVYIIK
jgi:hypothetical protein